MKNYHAILKLTVTAIIISSTAIWGCRKKEAPADDRPVVVVSMNAQRQMLEQIAGDDFQIHTLMPNGENPETFDPSAASRKLVADADMYFSTGYLTFEGNLSLNSKSVTKFIDTSIGIEPIYGTHGAPRKTTGFLSGEERKRSEADPHVWASVKNAQLMAANMVRGLSTLKPENAGQYIARAKTYIAHLDSLDHALAAQLDTVDMKSFLVWHPSLSYFARDYGLNQIAIGHEAKEPSASGMREVINEAKDNGIRTFFYQKSLDSRKAEAIGASIGATMVVIDPMAYDWEGTLKEVANAISGTSSSI